MTSMGYFVSFVLPAELIRLMAMQQRSMAGRVQMLPNLLSNTVMYMQLSVCAL